MLDDAQDADGTEVGVIAFRETLAVKAYEAVDGDTALIVVLREAPPCTSSISSVPVNGVVASINCDIFRSAIS